MQNAYKKLLAWASYGLLLLAPLLATNSASAQANKHPLSGTVSSAKDNSPLPGVAVVIKGSTTGALTDGEIQAADRKEIRRGAEIEIDVDTAANVGDRIAVQTPGMIASGGDAHIDFAIADPS